MATYTSETILGDVITADPSRTRILDRFGIDYCCHGQRPIGAACSEAQIDVDEVLTALNGEEPGPRADWADMADTVLIEHIIDTHHRFLWDEFPRMSALVDKVARVHGDNHPELGKVRNAFGELREKVEPHLRTEETTIFPELRTRGDAAVSGELRTALEQNMKQHDIAGELLAELRELTSGYAVPSDACASYTAMLAGLEEIESDLHLHVHKENNVLFARALARV
ncbi:iron-sulfur cluster repair di-iron protein [Mycobacterium sp.]|uniref:iron-sulfur cluster repair di-iron protein n=1 Tax=Mycobacterium sp. TaxID=1785 RepID=UPI00120C46C5|nr:iron-sulfur cluster repair di-iron protein [Mycobacterium sp.]TAM71487.1 MAG: iron-sulfur cluster repair di-iron protein [Mycobacterium sp.]